MKALHCHCEAIPVLMCVVAKKPHNEDEIIATYKRLIRSMPRANQYLLLYVLDLLSVFARKSDKNLMTAKSTSPFTFPGVLEQRCLTVDVAPITGNSTDLAVIFRPALIAHPSHELSPHEHHLSQDVLEFLIKHQDWFMLDIPPPPTTKPSDSAVTVPMTEPVADILASSDEEMNGWKLISRDAVPKKIGRRRTTTERSAGELWFSNMRIRPTHRVPACQRSQRSRQ